MAQSVGNITEQLASAFNLSKAAGWDPVGLEFGDPLAEVRTVAVCHEVTPSVVDQLIGEGVDLAVSYHPLLFKPVQRLVAGSGASGQAHRLIANGVSLLTVHTAFDVAPGGTADALAKELGLVEISGFGPAWGSDVSSIVVFVPPAASDDVLDAMAAAGAGEIGNYSRCSFRTEGIGSFLPTELARPVVGEPGVISEENELRIEMVAPRRRVDAVVAALVRAHPYEEPAYDVINLRSNAGFVGRRGPLASKSTVEEMGELVAERLGGVVRIAGSGSITSVAVIPGSGGSMLDAAEADLVVTGDVSHHQARGALARGTSIIDPGHAATERPGVQALYASVAEMIGNTIDMTDVDADPWKER
jgi:dinuclear metal center YbgI/SA1388 family protein